MQPPSTEQRLLLSQAASLYQQDLAADIAALEYLMKRGISPQGASSFGLGVVRRPITGHEDYTGRLAIPYLTPSGPVNLNFRCIRDHDCKSVDGHRKYLKPEGSEVNLFNVLDLKKPGGTICIAEGEIDTMSLSLAGIPAVGVAGVNAWSKHFGKCLEDFPRRLVLADGDEAGKKLASFLAREVRAVVIRLPPGEDVNSIYVKGGANALRRLIDGG